MTELDQTDKRLLSLLQVEVPVVEQPWKTLGEKLGSVPADEVLQRVQRLKDGELVRQISAIFDTRSLGYKSSLVAVKCDPAREDAAVAVINAHPGVSHNYRRNHPYNLWYTVAVGPHSRLGLEKTAQILHDQSGAITTRLMPTLHLFKIGVELDVEGTGRADSKGAVRYSQRNRAAPDAVMGEREMGYVREMQRDLPLEPSPFLAIADRLGTGLEELQQIGAKMIAAGQMRRYSAVLNHRKAGFTANGMGVWAARQDDRDAILRIGEQMAGFKAVSHCYLRPTYPDWPYNIFTMVHARTVPDCDAVLAEIARETGVTEYAALYSTKEYKKTRVEYFTAAEADWESRHAA
ncbi:Lrp/AsnC family transcriptional regulator [bacterium]|nr:Lrp/AsnC family transcriptional regulator [bacterium]